MCIRDRFKNGAYGLFEGTVNVYPKNLEETLYIFGSQGTVKAGGKSVNIIEEWEFADDRDDADNIMREHSENPESRFIDEADLRGQVIFAHVSQQLVGILMK